MKKALSILSLALATQFSFAAAPEFTITTTEVIAHHKMLEDEAPASGKFGDIIAMGKEVVALGESVYNLVIKGKPTSVTEVAPVSVVPKDPTTREPVSPDELENASAPTHRTYTSVIKNLAGKQVVSITYKIVYTYGASYEGKGKYLPSIQVVPVKVSVSWGWDFAAKMSVQSVLNHGTKENPVAGVLINLKYTMNSWSRAEERNDTLHIAGNGAIKFYGAQ